MNLAATLSQASPFVRPLAGVFALASVLGAAACEPVVVGGGSGGSGPGSSVVSSGSSGTAGAPATINALGVPYVLLQTNPSPAGGTGSGGPGSIDPNTLYVKIGNFPQSCAGGDAAPVCTSSMTWQVSVGIPPAMQVPGVLQLSDPKLISVFSESIGEGGNPGACSGGGGSFFEGTLEIVSIDPGTIVVTLSGTGANLSDFAADGNYVAPICPTGG